jgi:hypothetical protein
MFFTPHQDENVRRTTKEITNATIVSKATISSKVIVAMRS